MPEINKETYLGDGLYVSWDGWMVKLRAPRGWDDHVVFLEPAVYADFKKFADACMEELRREVEKARQADRGTEKTTWERQDTSSPFPRPVTEPQSSPAVQPDGHPAGSEKGTTEGDPGT